MVLFRGVFRFWGQERYRVDLEGLACMQVILYANNPWKDQTSGLDASFNLILDQTEGM